MNGIDEKTKEQILEETAEYDMREGSVIYVQEEVFEAMQAYADQEKRSTAIAFQEWAADKGWLLHPDCDEDEERAWYKPSDDFDIPDELMFGGQLYDLYLQSLPK